MTTSGIAEKSTGKKALLAIRKHFDQVSAVTFIQAAARLAFFALILFPGILGVNTPHWIAWLCAAAIYILAIIPLRFWAKEKMRRLFYSHHSSSRKKNPYEKWLKTGLIRYGRGFLWGIPFLIGFFYFVIGYSLLDAKTYEAPIHWLAMLLEGKSPSATGTGNVTLAMILIVCLMAFFAFLFAYGWWRDLSVEYLPVRSIGTRKSFRWAKRIRKNHGKEMRGHVAVNMLLTIPALIGFGAVAVLYVREKIDFSLPMQIVLNRVKNLLNNPLPTAQILELIAVFVILYLPFCVVRKMRNAALIGKLMRDQTEHHHRGGETKTGKENDGHAAG